MLEPSSQPNATAVATKSPIKKRNFDWLMYALIFVAALTVTSLHHLFEGGVKTALLFDGRHYFESCQRACALLLALSSMDTHAVVNAEQAFRDFVMLDGPILPLFFGAVYACFGRIPTSSDWTLIVWVQTFLQGIAALLICKLSYQMTRNKLVAVICSAMWILYPAALIASGRLMTEHIAVVLLLALPLAFRGALGSGSSEGISPEEITTDVSRSRLNTLSKILSTNSYGVVAGIVSGLLILLKPGMIPSVALCWLASLTMTRLKIRTALPLLLSLILGTGLALSPWLLYTKQTTGKAALTVQRMPVHNALIGWDPEIRGWQTNPPSGFERVLNTGGEPLSTIKGIWISHPQSCARILLDKFGHLYSTPWNDYRAKALGLNAQTQEFYHLALLFAGLSGAIAWLITDVRKRRLAVLCVAAAAGQCVYLMFEPVCRYAFPQSALAPVLFSIALIQIIGKPVNVRAFAIASLIACGAVALIVWSEVNSNHYLAEISYPLKAGDSITGKIALNPNAAAKANVALLLVDGDKRLTNADVFFNGEKLSLPLMPFNYFDPDRYPAFDLMKELAYGLDIPVDDFRLWRAVPVPLDQIKNGKLEVQIKAGTEGCTAFGDTSESRSYLSPDFLCVNRLINSKTSLEMRDESPILAARCDRSFKVNNGAANSTQGIPRIRLLLALKRGLDSGTQAARSPASNTVPQTTASTDEALTAAAVDQSKFEELLPASRFDENLHTQYDTVRISKSVLKSARTTGIIVPLKRFGTARHLGITLSGELKGGTKPGKVGIVIETITNKKHESLLARLPSYLPTAIDWKAFTITDIAPYRTKKGRVDKISIALFPGPWQQVAGYGCDKTCTDTEFRNLRITVEPISLPSINDKQLLYF